MVRTARRAGAVGMILLPLLLCASLAPAQVPTESECREMAFGLALKLREVIGEAILMNDVTPVARFMGREFADSVRSEIDAGLQNGQTLEELASPFRESDQQLREEVDTMTIATYAGYFSDVGNDDMEYVFSRRSGHWRVERLHFREADRTIDLNWGDVPDGPSDGTDREPRHPRAADEGGDAGSRGDKYTASRRYPIGSSAEAGDLRVCVEPELYLDSVTYASQSPDYYLIVRSVSIKNEGRHTLSLEEVRLGSCAPHLMVGSGSLSPITPPQPEFMYRCGIMDLLQRHGISYGDIEPGQNVQLAPGQTVNLAFVYDLSSPDLVAGEIGFRFWAVEVLEDGDVRDGGGSTLIVGERTQ